MTEKAMASRLAGMPPDSTPEAAAGWDAIQVREPVPRSAIAALAGGDAQLDLEDAHAGYGGMEILHGIDLQIRAGQSLCLIGPNGAGKSTVLNAIFGFAAVKRGRVRLEGRDITHERPEWKLGHARIAYVLQDSSVFPDLTVEQNLRLGAYLMRDARAVRGAVERIYERYPRIAERRREPARVLSGGERRLLEIARALMLDPALLLVDEPSIGLEPRYVDLVFAMLRDLQTTDGTSIVMVEQNARKGLGFADLGYVLVAGRVAIAGPGADLLRDRSIGRIFLGE